MKKSGTLEMLIKKEEDLLAMRKYAMESSLFTEKYCFSSLDDTSLFLSLDAGVLEHRRRDGKDTLLGSGYGWLASSTGHPTAKMVPIGHWTSSNERVRPGYTHP